MMTMEGVIPLLLLLLCFTSAADSQDCPKGRYGISCSLQCTNCQNEKCQKSTGSESNVAAIVGGVVVAILMVLTVAVVTCRKWFCKPKGQEPEAETTPQSDAGHFLLENSSKVGL
ncbi:uncharacterized protein [Haliotis cracherodii]|uniref:uncharacterized protein isoform X2 n=1 Tax=Haliotis cracherodii TaxID=6455 RepID=UPI0039E7581F